MDQEMMNNVIFFALLSAENLLFGGFVLSVTQSFCKVILPLLKSLSMRRIMFRLSLGPNYSYYMPIPLLLCLLAFVSDSLFL